MQAEQFLQLLRQSLNDYQLTRSEKTDLKSWLESAGPEPPVISQLRNAAFDLARTAISSQPAEGPSILAWLEDVVRLLHPQQTASTDLYARAWFSPQDDCPREICSIISTARHSIDLCVFTITDDRLTSAVIAAHQRGIRVRIITDNEKTADPGSDAQRFQDAGIPLRIDHTQWHMHHKYAIFDRVMLLNGSYNWTRGAAENNEENFLVLNHQPLVSRYQEQFELLWEKLAAFAGS